MTVSIERDADRAAEVAHHVEQSARIRDVGLREMPEREARRRQNAEHHREAAHHLRPEHLVVVRGAGLDAAHRHADAENEKSECRQIALVVTLLERGRERSGHKLHDAGHQNDHADLKRTVAPDIGQKHRHEVHRAEKSDAQDKAEQAADRKFRSRKVRKSTSGQDERSVRRTNTAPVMKLSTPATHRPKTHQNNAVPQPVVPGLGGTGTNRGSRT